ncbi:MAG: tetratricopeptide repeat protein [Bacteroidota bacterium]
MSNPEIVPRKYVLLIGTLLICLISFNISAKTVTEPDSLLQAIQSCRVDSVRNELYISLARLYLSSDTVRMKTCLQQMVEAVEPENRDLAKGLALNELGRMRSYHGDYPAASHCFDEAMTFFSKAGNMIRYHDAWVNKGNQFLFRASFDSALVTYQNCLGFYMENHIPAGINRCLNNMGIIYKNHGEYDKALMCYQQSLEYEIAEADSASFTKAWINIGNVHVLMGNYEEGIRFFNKALIVNERNGNMLEVSKCLLNIGVIHNKCGQYAKAYDYYKKSLAICRSLNNKELLSNCLINMGTNFSEMGEYQKALDYLRQGTEIREELGDQKAISNCYVYQAEIYTEIDRLKEAEELTARALEIKKGMRDLDGITRSLLLLSTINLKKDQLTQAATYANAGLDSALILGSLEHISHAYELLQAISSGEGDFRKAYEYMTFYKKYSDSLLYFQNSELVSELEFRYHAQVLEQENENLRFQEALNRDRIQEQQILIVGGIISVVLIALLLLVVAYYSQRKKQINLQLEKKNLTITKQNVKLDKLNKTKDKLLSIVAHDLRGTIGNQVTALNMLGKNENNISSSDRGKLISNLSNSASASLELLENLLVWTKMQEGDIEFFPQKTDVALITLNSISLLEQTARGKDLVIRNNTSGKVVCMVDEQMIGTVLRNLLMNAIKFSNRHSEIIVNTGLKDRYLVIEVIDHGIGIPEEALHKIREGNGGWSRKGTENERGSGLGLSMVHEFIKLHNGSMEIESREGEGSLFRVRIPCAGNNCCKE